MPLRLGIDFGTATTCMATVADLASFQARVIPFEDGSPVARTAVFMDRPVELRPLIQSRSEVGRHPLGVFAGAYELFRGYWAKRRKARTDGVAWDRWQSGRREEGMLLTHFKPELADNPVRVPLRVPRIVWGNYDGLAQSDSYELVFDERSLAMPDPDTNDLVAATAAVIRTCVERAISLGAPGERISHLAVGVPSLSGDATIDEQVYAAERRREAVELSGVPDEFGTDDFRLELYGEAEAAAWSIDIDSDRPVVYKLIVDVGAGTTDLALVEYARERPGVYRLAQRLLSRSIRFAGRDLNLALSEVMKANLEFRRGIAALDEVDERAWQFVMYEEVERVKCELTTQAAMHKVSFNDASAHIMGTPDYEAIAHALRCTAFVSLAVNDPTVKGIVRASLRDAWLPTIRTFVAECLEQIGGRRELLSVEKVGGAFRFAPLSAELVTSLQQQGLPITNLRFRDEAGQAQTMVARGLARWVAQLGD